MDTAPSGVARGGEDEDAIVVVPEPEPGEDFEEADEEVVEAPQGPATNTRHRSKRKTSVPVARLSSRQPPNGRRRSHSAQQAGVEDLLARAAATIDSITKGVARHTVTPEELSSEESNARGLWEELRTCKFGALPPRAREQASQKLEATKASLGTLLQILRTRKEDLRRAVEQATVRPEDRPHRNTTTVQAQVHEGRRRSPSTGSSSQRSGIGPHRGSAAQGRGPGRVPPQRPSDPAMAGVRRRIEEWASMPRGRGNDRDHHRASAFRTAPSTRATTLPPERPLRPLMDVHYTRPPPSRPQRLTPFRGDPREYACPHPSRFEPQPTREPWDEPGGGNDVPDVPGGRRPGEWLAGEPDDLRAPGLSAARPSSSRDWFETARFVPRLDSFGSRSTPTWASSRNPYAPGRCDLGDNYWLSFPHPWNAIPQASTAPPGELLKVASNSLPKFTGERRSYLAWRSSFIPCVHLTAVDLSFKVMLLQGSMATETARMREFVDSILCTPDGYLHAVRTLEDRYGGEEGLLLARQEALMTLPEVREGDYRVIEMAHGRLGVFLLDWEGCMAASWGPASRLESLTLFTMLLSKLEESLSLKYMNWLDRVGLKSGLRSMHAWLGELLKHHRALQHLPRRRPPPRKPFRKDYEAASSPQTVPPSYLDRNYKGNQFFVEEATGGGREEEAEDHSAFVDDTHRDKPTAFRRGACIACSEIHPLGKCPKFREMDVPSRRELLYKARRCFMCFQLGHGAMRCTMQIRCTKCKARHHTLLHKEETGKVYCDFEDQEWQDDLEAAVEALDTVLVINDGEVAGRVSLRTVPVVVEDPRTGRAVTVNALLDDGSTGTISLSRTLAEELQLKGDPIFVRTEGTGGNVQEYWSIKATVRIRSLCGTTRFVLPVQVAEKPAGNYAPVDWTPLKDHFPHLKQVAVAAPVPQRRVDLLIGNRFPFLQTAVKEISGKPEEPVARLTPLGWTITGPTTPGAALHPEPDSCFLQELSALQPLSQLDHDKQDWMAALAETKSRRALPSDQQLATLLKRMLEVEGTLEVETLSPLEQHAVDRTRATCRRVGQQYEIGCVWGPADLRPQLGLVRAKKRLTHLLQSKLLLADSHLQAYDAVFDDWLREDFIEEVPLASAKHLLPHFPVFKDSPTTPVRPVMDCKVELNKYVVAGPNLLNEVAGVLLRFRSGLYSFAGDVKQMFLKILLPEQDRPYHCFLWRRPGQSDLVCFQFKVHVFGNAGSPFVAVFLLKEHTILYQSQFPAAVETLRQSTLIDDVLDSMDTIDEARATLDNVRTILE
jgi:hypothetical protein